MGKKGRELEVNVKVDREASSQSLGQSRSSTVSIQMLMYIHENVRSHFQSRDITQSVSVHHESRRPEFNPRTGVKDTELFACNPISGGWDTGGALYLDGQPTSPN